MKINSKTIFENEVMLENMIVGHGESPTLNRLNLKMKKIPGDIRLFLMLLMGGLKSHSIGNTDRTNQRQARSNRWECDFQCYKSLS